MAFCSFSSRLALDGYTVIDNAFFNEFLPNATGDDIKVYLYGLSLCNNPDESDNSLDTFCKVLSMTEDQVLNAFSYWQELGLVQIASTHPFEIKFFGVKHHSGSTKIRNKDKYSDFNIQMQSIISGRMITPNEFNEYYILIETYHIEPEALCLIAKYCTDIKSTSIGYPYILAVAKDFAREGIKTLETVEEKFVEHDKSTQEIKQVLKTLGIKREADIDERNLYLKWTNGFGFTHGVVLEIAKTLNKKGGFIKLNSLISKFYEQKLFTMEQILSFSAEQEHFYEIAKNVSRTLGLYYQSLDNVVDTYIISWNNLGFESNTLEYISNYCFKQSIRTLEGMNTIVQKFYKLGLISLQSIEQYIEKIIQTDQFIREILNSVNLVRGVSSFDRDYYKTWTENWNFSHDKILLVAEICKDKINPMAYLNKLLADFFASGTIIDKNSIKSLKSTKPNTTKIQENYATHTYTKEQMTAVFDSLDDVEI